MHGVYGLQAETLILAILDVVLPGARHIGADTSLVPPTTTCGNAGLSGGVACVRPACGWSGCGFTAVVVWSCGRGGRPAPRWRGRTR